MSSPSRDLELCVVKAGLQLAMEGLPVVGWVEVELAQAELGSVLLEAKLAQGFATRLAKVQVLRRQG